ncbi:hypothetical protein M3Y98_01179600 [Aphelenchoides besseyi]|nr:hypothetical protein M3Y98_01179600 [Aphelenchoides besseyi]KAI6211055.1 hypothetical protein M3Y96_00392700 [Aphelenchoides besseyi]
MCVNHSRESKMEVSDLEFAVRELKLDDKLSITGYSVEWILTKLHEHNPEFVEKLGDGKVKNISALEIGAGHGFLSRVFKVEIEFDKPSNSTYSCIMKIPTHDNFTDYHKTVESSEEEIRASKRRILDMHNVECQGYSMVNEISGFPTPKAFYIQESNEQSSGLIIMEDLSSFGTTTGIFYSAPAPLCLTVARHVAAYMENVSREKWSGRFPSSWHVSSVSKGWSKMFKQIQNYDPSIQPFFDILLKMDLQRLSIYTLIDYPKENDLITLTHGDLWSNNMLIKKNADGTISNEVVAYIDFQTIFEASPLLDIARFVVNCSDSDVRRENDRKIVDCYYDALVEEYRKYDKKPKFSREKGFELYELAMVQETIILVFMFYICAYPLIGKPEADEKVANLWKRTRDAVEDSLAVVEKYKLLEHCRLDD